MTEQVPEEPIPVPDEIAVQDGEQAIQQETVSQANDLADLVKEMIKQSTLDFDPATFRKGVITAINSAGVPPTLSLLMSGDTSVTVDGVRYVDSYSPTVNDTVLVLKQAADIVVLGHVAEGGTNWVTPTLSAGFTTNGDSQGAVQYRRVFDGGSWKVQWKGAVSRASGTTIMSGLPAEVRPASQRKMVAARGFGGGSVAIQLVFSTAGAVTTAGGAFSFGSGTTSSELNLPTAHNHGGASGGALGGYLSQAGSDLGHSHSISTTTFATTHSHDITGVAVTDTDWISFNGIEYFL